MYIHEFGFTTKILDSTVQSYFLTVLQFFSSIVRNPTILQFFSPTQNLTVLYSPAANPSFTVKRRMLNASREYNDIYHKKLEKDGT